MNPEYITIKSAILDGTLKSYSQIFNHISKTTVAGEINIHPRTMSNRLVDLGKATLDEIYDFAELVGVDPLTIFNLMAVDYVPERKKRPNGWTRRYNGSKKAKKKK